MIEHLDQSRGPAFGFAVHGVLTAADTEQVSTQLDHLIATTQKPIGLLADLRCMEGADWAARWEEMRFLQKHTTQIARLAIVGVSGWEELASMVVVATAVLQAQTLYFLPSEITHAWHWVKMLDHDEDMPVRVLFPGQGLFQDSAPEFMGI